MKHRLASQGPTGRLWPTFPILLLFISFLFFFLRRNKRCPSLSFLLSSRRLVGSSEERLSPKKKKKLGWGMRGCLLLHVCHFFLRELKARSGGGGREIEGTAD